MSEMIEKVAKAIFDRGSVLQKEWDDADDGHRDFYRILAKEAIQAMREPTDEMLVEMEQAAPAYTSFAAREDSPSFKAYKAAIDAALKD